MIDLPHRKRKSVGHFNEKDNHEATISESDNHKKDSNLETYEEGC